MENTTARQVIFLVLIFSAVIAGSFSLIALSVPNADVGSNFSSSYNTTLNKFGSIQEQSDQLSSVMQSNSNYGTIETITTAGWGIMTLIWGSLDAFRTVMLEIPTMMGIVAVPGWFIGLLLSFIFITVVFAFLAAIFHWFI